MADRALRSARRLDDVIHAQFSLREREQNLHAARLRKRLERSAQLRDVLFGRERLLRAPHRPFVFRFVITIFHALSPEYSYPEYFNI